LTQIKNSIERSDFLMNTDNLVNNSEKNIYHRRSLKKAALWLAAFVVAFLLWFYVSSTVAENIEYAEKNLDLEIQYEGTEILSENELGIEQSDFDMVTITIYGEKSVVDKIKQRDVRAYVDVSDEDITEAGEYKFEIKFDTGKLKGITRTYQSISNVELTIDKVKSQEFPISSTNISLSGWTLDKGYTISSDKSVNINQIVIEGMTLALDNIKSIKIESVSVNVISGAAKKETDAKVVLYDAQGKVIDSDDFVINAYFVKGADKTEVKDIKVSFEVVKASS